MTITFKRKSYLGSHDIAGISGLHPFLSPIKVYMNKQGIGPVGPVNEAMEWGLKLEGKIVEHYEERHKIKVTRPEGPIFCKKPPYLGATPDGIISPKEVLDAKNIRWKTDNWGDPGTDKVPPYILLQAHTHMTCTEAQRCIIAALFSGQSYEEFIVERDEEMVGMIQEIARDFWENHIIPKIPPELDHSKDSREYLLHRFKADIGEIRGATPYEDTLLLSLATYKKRIAELEKTKAGIENRLIERIGEFKGIQGKGGKALWYNTKGSVSWKSVATDLGAQMYGDDFEQADPYKKILESYRGAGGRSFRYTPPKDKEE